MIAVNEITQIVPNNAEFKPAFSGLRDAGLVIRCQLSQLWPREIIVQSNATNAAIATAITKMSKKPKSVAIRLRRWTLDEPSSCFALAVRPESEATLID